MTYSERELEFTFAKNCNCLNTRSYNLYSNIYRTEHNRTQTLQSYAHFIFCKTVGGDLLLSFCFVDVYIFSFVFWGWGLKSISSLHTELSVDDVGKLTPNKQIHAYTNYL